MKKVGIIIGSTREGRAGKSVADHIKKLADSSNKVVYELIDLKEVNLPFLNEPLPPAMGQYKHEHTKAWAKTVSGYDAFIIVTSEYNHGYPASLKNALDTVYNEWNHKHVAFVGYGYSANGARSVAQLRQVTGYLQLKHIWRDVLINLGVNSKDGVFQSDEKLNASINAMLTDLEKALV